MMQNSKTLQELKLNKLYKIKLNECNDLFNSLFTKHSSSLNSATKGESKTVKIQILSTTLLAGTYKINIVSHDLKSQGTFVTSVNMLKDVKFYDA